MGADIHSFVEIKKDGKWELFENEVFPDYRDKKTSDPFGHRNYSVFGFLADVRNYSHCKPICEPKWLPEDSEYLNSQSDHGFNWLGEKGTSTKRHDILEDGNYHSYSWLTLKELIDFDYDSTFEDRRITINHFNEYGGVIGSNGSGISEVGGGSIISYREHLGESFFEDLKILKTLGDPENIRIIFYFDN